MTPIPLDELRRHYVDLAQPRLGAEVVYANDEFFADKERLISPGEPVFIPGKYDDHGKWMDGWETRRKRGPGHDFCIVRLGRPGVVAGFEIDTRHFTGNYPPGAELEVCRSVERIPEPDTEWTPVTPRLALQGNGRQFAPADPALLATHVRFNIHPDGGVARLRIWGRVAADTSMLGEGPLDLLAMANGGRGLFANDEHFGRVENLTAPGRGADMGDGWETRRRREPGHDWAILELGCEGEIEEILVDTAHFKGNYPDSCSIQAAPAMDWAIADIAAASEAWPLLLPQATLKADHEHRFKGELAALGPVKLIRLNIFPDGGVSRLRLIGRPVG